MTDSNNLREYADSARRAYSALARKPAPEWAFLRAVNVADIDMYLAERSTYLAEYKLALTEAYELARAEVLGADMLKHAKCQDGIYCHGPGCKLRAGKPARKKTG